MPTYSYACKECGNSFDIVQKFSDDTLTVCTQCNGPLRKLFNSVGIVFKGSGFYRTDSRSGAVPAKSGEASSESSGASGSASGDSAGSSSSGSSKGTSSAGDSGSKAGASAGSGSSAD